MGQDGRREASVWSRFGVPIAGTESPHRLVLVTAWLFVVFGTQIPVVVGSEVAGIDRLWVVLGQGSAAGGLLLATALDERFRPLQSFALALLAVKAAEVFPTALLLDRLDVAVSAGQGTTVAYLLTRGLVPLALLAVLLARGETRESVYLRPSDLSATAAAGRLPGFRRPRPWRLHGPLVGGTVVATLALFLALGGARFAVWAVSARELLGIAVVVVVVAGVNAFTEEFLFRAAPLVDLADALGKRQATVLLGVFFGLSHYYGTPGGVPGVFMTLFLGWWLTRSLLETRGLTVAWTVHFVLDVVVLSAWFLP